MDINACIYSENDRDIDTDINDSDSRVDDSPEKYYCQNVPGLDSLADEFHTIAAFVMSNCVKLRLEAIFHPKFENEKSEDVEKLTRQRMIFNVECGFGYLEVSVKHSGSLLLWSGGQRYYSKNSTNNQYSSCGEILLRQHFVRSCWSNDKHSLLNVYKGESLYHECSLFVEKNRLTLSFEVVTTVLGDHGDRPKRDFLILTAVANRSSGSFFSTPDLLEFALHFKLPHNDIWIYSTGSSADNVFTRYDSFREDGYSDAVVDQLNQTSDICIPGLYQHSHFQGEIMEGIVIRYVRSDGIAGTSNLTNLIDRMRCLADKASVQLQCIPLSLLDCHQLLRDRMDMKTTCSSNDFSPLLLLNLRSMVSPEDKPSSFDDKINKCMASDFRYISGTVARLDGHCKNSIISGRRQITKFQGSASWIPELAASLLDPSSSSDWETKRVAKAICDLSSITKKVNYLLYKESNNAIRYLPGKRLESDLTIQTSNRNRGNRLICTVHVFHDETFRKFQRKKGFSDLPLFRGFSFELVLSDESEKPKDQVRNQTEVEDLDSSLDEKNIVERNACYDDEMLMLKMKLLPYMVRTFCCRNGLPLIKQGEKLAFLSFVSKQFDAWRISIESRQKWTSFVSGWADYAYDWFRKNGCSSHGLPELSTSNYLNHLNIFAQHFATKKVEDRVDNAVNCSSQFQGILIVVSLLQNFADEISNHLAVQCGCCVRFSGCKNVTREAIVSASTAGHGQICSATVSESPARLRGLAKEYLEFITIVFFACTGTELGDEMKFKSMLSGWEKVDCAAQFHLPLSALKRSDNWLVQKSYLPSLELTAILTYLKAINADDDIPGILIFFPLIPGSGKSALCVDIEENSFIQDARSKNGVIKRRLNVLVGDEIKQKYWQLVKIIRNKHTSGILITDKNAPAGIWRMIGQICASSKAFAVAVVPQLSSMQTTKLFGGRNCDGVLVSEGTVHVYPFSLIFLALCMTRVLDRPPGAHPGRLDPSAKQACLTVISFYTFYRNIEADNFFESISHAVVAAGGQMSNSPIELPMQRCSVNLPRDLLELLVEGLQYQFAKDVLRVPHTKDEHYIYSTNLESRLRTCIKTHRNLVLSLSSDLELVRGMLVSRIVEQIAFANAYNDDYSAPVKEFAKLASIDVAWNNVKSLLLALTDDSRMSSFFESCFDGSNRFDDLKRIDTLESFVPKPHVTMAHSSCVSQFDIRTLFEPLVGQTVTIFVVGFIWTKRNAAFAVKVPDTTNSGMSLPSCNNTFPHMTVWHLPGTSAAASNDLQSLAACHEAESLYFDSPKEVDGVVGIWL